MFYEKDNFYMSRALKLAEKRKNKNFPNPAVGAVIVKNNKIISEGFHKGPGTLHAEREAIINSKKKVEGSTLYINLEPCSHYGKTPPCTDIIIKNKIKEVVFSLCDPNNLVDGKGKKILLENKIKVRSGLMTEKALSLNLDFYIKHLLKRPRISLKTASSIDGFITDEKDMSKWITGDKARIFTHKLRAQHQAIIVGTKTIVKDNPLLNIRFSKGKNPIKIILDRNGILNKNLNIFKNNNSIVFTKNKKYFMEAEILQDFRLENILKILSEKYNIFSLFVEGGSELLSEFYYKGYYEFYFHFIAPFLLGKGKNLFSKSYSLAKHPVMKRKYIKKIERDILIKYEKYPFSIFIKGDKCFQV